jgi:hypothetical protein
MPLLFLLISIFGIATTAITVKTYLDTGKEKDSNFNFSATVLAISCLTLLTSGYFAYKAYNGAPVNVTKMMGGMRVPANAASAAAGSMAPQPFAMGQPFATGQPVAMGVPVAQPVGLKAE